MVGMLRRDLGGRPVLIDTSSVKLWFLTSNRHKYMEVEPIARKYGVELEMLPGEKVEIQSSSLREIALYSLLEAYKQYRKPLMVEDAGLFIEALNGFPGPYSSYVYKTIGVNGVLKLMEGIEDRRAYFRSVVAIIYEPYIVVEENTVYGEIALEPRGDKGFGFDPIFKPMGLEKTFGEMSVSEKNMYSHRAGCVKKAFSKLVRLLKTYNTL